MILHRNILPTCTVTPIVILIKSKLDTLVLTQSCQLKLDISCQSISVAFILPDLINSNASAGIFIGYNCCLVLCLFQVDNSRLGNLEITYNSCILTKGYLFIIGIVNRNLGYSIINKFSVLIIFNKSAAAADIYCLVIGIFIDLQSIYRSILTFKEWQRRICTTIANSVFNLNINSHRQRIQFLKQTYFIPGQFMLVS